MLRKIALMLNDLDGQLEVLWIDYLTARPEKWLWELEHSRAQLAEARELYGVIQDLKDHVYTMRCVINENAYLNPIREES